MALVTVQRELSTKPRPKVSVCSDAPVTADSDGGTKYLDEIDAEDGVKEHDKKQRSVSECYFVVKGAALILPHDECMRVYRKSPNVNGGTNDIQNHLKSMFYLLWEEDTLRMAVKLESIHPGRARYLVVVSCMGAQNQEESCLLGIDCGHRTTIGLVLPVFADTTITLDGDGGFSISSSLRHHIFKPVSVQAMWSALQTLHKCSAKARDSNYFTTSGSHQWVDYYEKRIKSDRSCLNEWNAMDDLVSRRPPSPDSVRSKPTERESTENLIRVKLKEVMMSVDLDEVTSKCIRASLEDQLDVNLDEYKSFIDQEMLTILGQMDAPTEIFEYLYLGSEWNASNLEELKAKGVDHILNVTREIDNFFPGLFDYLNVRVYDDESTEMLKHWDKTFKYIRKVKSEGSKVLVHCKMGISRSASVVIAYVMKAYDWNFEQALDFVRNKRSCIKPNHGFVKQLEIYQGILDASKQRHNSLWRSKSETNLKIIGIPRHLKKKEFGGNRYGSASEEKKSLIGVDHFFSELKIPGSMARPKSWSPDDSAVECLFSNSPCLEDKFGQFGEPQSTADPAYYLNLEAGSSSSGIFRDEKVLDTLCSSMTKEIPRVSSIKTRISELESHGGSLSSQEQKTSASKSDLNSMKGGTALVNNKSGSKNLVLNLATQFESGSTASTPSPEVSTEYQRESPENSLKLDISVSEPVLSRTKQPPPKHRAVLVKTSTSNVSVTPNEDFARLTTVELNQIDASPYGETLNQSSLTGNEKNRGDFSKRHRVVDDENSPSIVPSQTNALELLSRQSSSSSCISTPKSAELPFSWSRQSSCSSAVSSPPVCQRWPKTTSLAPVQDDWQSYGECETYSDVKTVREKLTRGFENAECSATVKDIVYEREDIPWTPGTVRRTKQKLESHTLKRTASFDSSFPSQSRSTPSTPPESTHADGLESGQSPVARSKSLKREDRPRSMAGVFPSNWHATPPTTDCSPIPQSTVRMEKTKFSRMHHSRSTPSVVEAVNRVLCGTREILDSAIQSLPSQSIPISSLLSLSKDYLALDLGPSLSGARFEKPSPNNRQLYDLSTMPSSDLVVEAYNSNVGKTRFPGKKRDSAYVRLGTPENKGATVLLTDSEVLGSGRGASSRPKLNASFSDDVETKLSSIKDGSDDDLEGQAEQIKLVTKQSGHLVESENESNSSGVVKRLTKELEAKSGASKGGMASKKDSGVALADPIKSNLGFPAAESLASSRLPGAKTNSTTETRGDFLRKVRARSDGSNINYKTIESTTSNRTDSDVTKKTSEENSDANLGVPENGDVSSQTDKPLGFLRKRDNIGQTRANRTASTGRPPPGTSKLPLNRVTTPPTSQAAMDAASQAVKCRQQQGKTHPLSKLSAKQRHQNQLYNTM